MPAKPTFPLYIKLVTLVALVHTPYVEARFLVDDADEIDQEERLSTETYNDKLSYRFPVVWDRLWAEKDAGYRISAGSLNASRFDYQEDIKFGAALGKPVSFSFSQQRQEDVIEARIEQAIRIDWQPVAPLNLAILGDGGTHKQFGDLGAAIGFKPAVDQNVEVYYWSTDHYYDSKKRYPDDSRSRQTFTVGLKADWKFSDQLRLWFDSEFDKPLSWDRQSRDYQYDAWRRTTDFKLAMGDEKSIGGYVSAFLEEKEEGKVFAVTETTSHEKTMSRDVSIYETGVYHTAGTTVVTTGVQVVQRYADYTFEADTDVLEADYVEEPGPDDSTRRELGYFATAYFGPSRLVNTQLGTHINQVSIDEDGDEWRETEIKLQSAFDFLLTTEARIFLNLTWDIDQLQKDYPYTDSGFKPWGGGNIQFLAVF